MSLILLSDRVEEPRQKGQSPPLSDVEQDRAEAESALGPPPTGPPSTVSRSGRVVYRAAKVSVCATDRYNKIKAEEEEMHHCAFQ